MLTNILLPYFPIGSQTIDPSVIRHTMRQVEVDDVKYWLCMGDSSLETGQHNYEDDYAPLKGDDVTVISQFAFLNRLEPYWADYYAATQDTSKTSANHPDQTIAVRMNYLFNAIIMVGYVDLDYKLSRKLIKDLVDNVRLSRPGTKLRNKHLLALGAKREEYNK